MTSFLDHVRASTVGKRWAEPIRRGKRIAQRLALDARLRSARRRSARHGLPERRELRSFNRFFYRSCVDDLAREKTILETFDTFHYARLNESRLLGQIVFEYGVLLNWNPPWSGLRVLDVGTGGSRFPHWMAAQGADVTTLDLPSPLELSLWEHQRASRAPGDVPAAPNHVTGSMFELPFPDDSFDLVTSLSVIEHVDTRYPGLEYVPYEEQKQLAARSLGEMVRVARPGGHIYLTSDCCDFSRATDDAWRSAYYFRDGPELSGGWPVGDVRALFYDSVTANGCQLVGPLNIPDDAICGNPEFETFRGKFWSAFSMLAEKMGDGSAAH